MCSEKASAHITIRVKVVENNSTVEIWKDINNWPLHQVSSLGRVRVLPGGRIGQRIASGIELRKLSYCNGYMTIRQRKRLLRVHHLVLNAFVGPCPPGYECRHLNDDRSDNRWPENIVWGTRVENQGDRISHGTSNRGERHGMSKLTDSEVLEIRNRLHVTQRELSKEYGVTQGAISRIRSGQAWKFV
jgi:hypothetical protein